jgi:cell wall-associated NlpC family hydrolase
MRQYLNDVFGYSTTTLPSKETAYSIFINANDSRFTKILNTPTGIPQKGDIIFWNTTIGSAGHVAIFISGDAKSFISLDQNWSSPSATKGSVAAKITHNYTGVAGWLHPK